jgi:hypothetical protein
MKYYSHWIKIPFMYHEGEQELKEYINKYPESVIYIYPHRHSFSTYAQIKCEQNYYDLDLKINMCYKNCLRYIKHKPKDIFFSS